MSVTPNASLLTLPIEILYRILDQLDIKDILLSFRNVCVHFRAITNNYNRYKIQLISTSPENDIRLICRMIRPEDVISCALTSTHSKSDHITSRIELFLSLIDIHQFTRLQSLDLFCKDDCNFNELMRHISCVSAFTLLSLRWTISAPMDHDTIGLLSSIVVMSSLHKLHLGRIDPKIYMSPRTNPCKLEALTIDNCSHKELCDVLHHLPDL